MAWAVPVILLAWPVVEITVFVQVAHWLGWLAAIAGIVLSGLLGLALLRDQGLAAATRVQTQLAEGRMPIGALFDAACLGVAGVLLIIPGYVGDALAGLLLLPPVRAGLRAWLASRFAPAMRRAGDGNPVIDGEWHEVDGGDDHKRLR